MTFQDFQNTQSGHNSAAEIFKCGLFENYPRFSVSIETSANADTLENCNSGLIHTFSKANSSIHGVCSVLSFHAVFAFQNCLLGCAETKGQTCIQEN